ncbi:hypothetical protein AURANDRAFT_63284 [Aureococcus anophagefferens]|uniref:Uncharacterized protein n=1 Tax=Aureococcus anophagefferens TaxID=44056 RepID=F0Y639_AURAN|nr:hypothetical protein AURANDRAFT_63284 [Aureococcus anophagefferens]EGB09594.1 hypothetical protein AURANDRAFT_63284 [Aureococcus anophagefferens]|eukprot:XP_009035648.1 hypothetical protein AURANDRAFT_63284 [Aureococcus anophagefferens]
MPPQRVLTRCVALIATADALAAPRSYLRNELSQPAASLPQAVQTQVCYLAGFHDEPKAKWVAAFGEPSVTLDVERVSDKSVQPRYHGLDAFCEESGTPDAVDYFSAMIRAATVRYSVRYEVGTVDDGRGSAAAAAPEGLAGATSGAADLLGSACQFPDASLAPKYTASKAAGGSSAPSWMAGGVGAAAASRRRNPFLRRERTAPAWRAACDASGVASYADFGVRLGASAAGAPAGRRVAAPTAAAWRAACDASGVASYADFGIKLAAAGVAGPLASNPAAACRRRNPFLKREKKYVEYDETIEPKQMAQLIMRTREQLAAEISYDLRALVPDASPASVANMAARPAASMYDHSPLRRASFDLCERLATRTAALIAIQEVPAAWARYLKTRLAPDDVDRRPRAAAPPAGDDGGALARELADRVCELQQYRDALGDHCADTGKAAAWLQDLLDTPAFESASGSAIDPPAIANNILRIRGELAAAWAEAIVDDVKGEHAVLRREILERSLVAE